MPTTRRRKTVVEEPGLIAEQIRDLSDNVLACRTLRHAWKRNGGFYRVDVEGGVKGALYVERTIHCLRECDVVRVELFRIHPNHMERLSVKYGYPKRGYKLTGPREGLNINGMLLLEEYMREMAAANNLT